MHETYTNVQSTSVQLGKSLDEELSICWSAVPDLVMVLKGDLGRIFGAPIEIRSAHVGVSSLSDRHGAPYIEFGVFPAHSRLKVASVCCLFVHDRVLVSPTHEPESPAYLAGFSKIVRALEKGGGVETELLLIL